MKVLPEMDLLFYEEPLRSGNNDSLTHPPSLTIKKAKKEDFL